MAHAARAGGGTGVAGVDGPLLRESDSDASQGPDAAAVMSGEDSSDTGGSTRLTGAALRWLAVQRGEPSPSGHPGRSQVPQGPTVAAASPPSPQMPTSDRGVGAEDVGDELGSTGDEEVEGGLLSSGAERGHPLLTYTTRTSHSQSHHTFMTDLSASDGDTSPRPGTVAVAGTHAHVEDDDGAQPTTAEGDGATHPAGLGATNDAAVGAVDGAGDDAVTRSPGARAAGAVTDGLREPPHLLRLHRTSPRSLVVASLGPSDDVSADTGADVDVGMVGEHPRNTGGVGGVGAEVVGAEVVGVGADIGASPTLPQFTVPRTASRNRSSTPLLPSGLHDRAPSRLGERRRSSNLSTASSYLLGGGGAFPTELAPSPPAVATAPTGPMVARIATVATDGVVAGTVAGAGGGAGGGGGGGGGGGSMGSESQLGAASATSQRSHVHPRPRPRPHRGPHVPTTAAVSAASASAAAAAVAVAAATAAASGVVTPSNSLCGVCGGRRDDGMGAQPQDQDQDQDQVVMIQCGLCGAVFHEACLSSPLDMTAARAHGWRCASCSTGADALHRRNDSHDNNSGNEAGVVGGVLREGYSASGGMGVGMGVGMTAAGNDAPNVVGHSNRENTGAFVPVFSSLSSLSQPQPQPPPSQSSQPLQVQPPSSHSHAQLSHAGLAANTVSTVATTSSNTPPRPLRLLSGCVHHISQPMWSSRRLLCMTSWAFRGPW